MAIFSSFSVKIQCKNERFYSFLCQFAQNYLAICPNSFYSLDTFTHRHIFRQISCSKCRKLISRNICQVRKTHCGNYGMAWHASILLQKFRQINFLPKEVYFTLTYLFCFDGIFATKRWQ